MKFVYTLLIMIAFIPTLSNAEDAKSTTSTRVLMSTSLGDVEIKLFPKEAPITVKNFLSYIKSGFYDGTIFHRVMPGFVVQGGGFTAKMKKKDTMAPIKNEANNGLKNLIGTLSMARLPNPDSATSQFFVSVRDNSNLDYVSPAQPGYAVFGKVAAGMDVINKMTRVQTKRYLQYSDVPVTPVVINSMKVMASD